MTIADPYSYLALQIIKQAFRDIEAYYTGRGSMEDIIGGKDAILWIKHMRGTFRTCCLCSDLPVEKIHQMCLERINLIKKQALHEANQI